jgi:hypothetical protein
MVATRGGWRGGLNRVEFLGDFGIMAGTRLFMNDWNIQSRAHACQNCHKPFADKEAFHTLLFDQKKDFSRLDVCQECWKTQFAQGAVERKGFISYWQGEYSVAPPPPPEPIRKETAETVLRRLVAANDPAHGPACYILAVMLERKRILRVKDQVKVDGRRRFIYEHPKTGDVFDILDPDLHLDQLQAVQEDVASLLEAGADSTAPVPGAVAAVAPESSPEVAETSEAEAVSEAGNEPVEGAVS